MARILRGDIIRANLDPVIDNEQVGKRSVLILSHNVFNENSGTIIAVAITGKEQRAGFPLTMEINSKNLPQKSWIKISQVRTLSVNRLGEKITHIREEDLLKVIEGLNEIIG